MKDLHTHVVELLPWYVNGTLSAGDRDVVEQHCGECLPCRRALREEQSVDALVRRAGMPSAEAIGRARLFATIDDEGSATVRNAFGLLERFPGRTALAAAAGAAVAFVVAVWVVTATPGRDTDAFTTLSTPSASAAPRIDVVFASDAPPAAIGAVVESLGATIVAGPSEIGRYTFALPAGADVPSVLTRLREDSRVRFAGPTYIED